MTEQISWANRRKMKVFRCMKADQVVKFTPPWSSPVEAIEHWARTKPGRPALSGIIDGQHWIHRTYCQLLRRVLAVSRLLRSMPNQRLIIACGQHVSTIEMTIAAMSVGWEFTPIDLLRTPADLQNYKLEHSKGEVLIIPALEEMPDALIDKINKIHKEKRNLKIWSLGQNPLASLNLLQSLSQESRYGHFEFNAEHWDTPTGLFYSSGRHGKPRGYFFSTLSICANAVSIIDWLKLAPRSRFLLAMEVDNCEGLMPLLATIFAGGTAIVYPKISAGNFWQAVPECDCDFVRTNTSLIEDVLDNHSKLTTVNRRNLKYIITGSNYLPRQVGLKFFETFDLPILQSYGCTEAGGYVLAMHPNLSWRNYELAIRDNIVGKELAYCNVKLKNATCDLNSDQSQGQIQIRGHQLSLGKWNGDAIEYWPESWLSTEDIAETVPDIENLIYQIKGKLQDTLMIDNQQYWPAYIERSMLDTFTFLIDCIAMALPNENGNNILYTVIILPEDMSQHRQSEILALMEARLRAEGVPGLTGGSIPQEIIALKENEITFKHDGKPDREELYKTIIEQTKQQELTAS